jgi:predicted O-methyltransferase YrrM
MTTYRDSLSAYVSQVFAVEDPILKRVRLDIPRMGLPAINITPEEGRFLQLLVRACGAKRALEFGALGGYSGIWITRGLVEGGKLITLEVDAYHAQVARDHFAAAGVSRQVEVRLGEAHNLLDGLAAEGPYDFVFIDADKIGYPDYFEWSLKNTSVGAIIAAHNAFRGGRIVSAEGADEGTRVIHALNQRVASDPKLISSIYPAGDGTLIAVKAS